MHDLGFDPIPDDFNAELVFNTNGVRAYVSVFPTYYHFIVGVVNKTGGLNMSQHFFPRMPFMLALMGHWKSTDNPLSDVPPNRLYPGYLDEYNPEISGNATALSLHLEFNAGRIHFNQLSDTLTRTMLADAHWYRQFLDNEEAVPSLLHYLRRNKKVFSASQIEPILEVATHTGLLGELEFEAQFRVKGRRNRNHIPQSGLVHLLALSLDPKPFDDFMYAWNQTLSYCYATDHCACGSDYCFFPLVKPMQQQYFPREASQEADIQAYWEQLNPMRRAVLIGLFDWLGVTPVVSMGMFEPDWSNQYLTEAHSEANGLQPDDETKMEIGRVISMASTWLYQQGCMARS